mgnify:CR=1 FL=1
MMKGKKYDCRVAQDDTGWTAEIIRKITSKKIVVSKSQGGFASESEAQEWGKTELETFLKNLSNRNKRHSEQRKQEQAKKRTSDSEGPYK